ncbi:MAG TPA: CPBP family intramembrane glutamic endopeptidase [Candidatus Dormibacteraeota bacterium]|nr:CPBP family intramembrane glutamic endopeptidase [Candidatus Dormibacteraeota bacterium]
MRPAEENQVPPAPGGEAAENLPEPARTAPGPLLSQSQEQEPGNQPPKPQSSVPDDLRVPWSWLHVIAFVFFFFASQLVVVMGMAGYFAGARHMKFAAVQTLLTTNTPIVVAEQLLLFGALLFFLYVAVGVLYQVPFWRTIGWRPFGQRWTSPRLWFLTGCMLALGVGVASSRLQPTGPMPIQELFKDRTGTLLLMGFAVLVAPLVEETIFRGFLYPVFARSFGVPAGILLTGILFGLLHGGQLGWTWGYVGLLTTVGIIFTLVRARTGTVYASYLCHLGYNFMLFLGSAVATKGFTHFKPPGA